MLKLSFSLMKLPNLQNEGRKVSESFMKFHELKLSILEVSEPYSPIPSPSMFRYQVYSVLKLTGLPLFTFAQSFGVQPKD